MNNFQIIPIKSTFNTEKLGAHFEKKCGSKIMKNYFEYVICDEALIFSDDFYEHLQKTTSIIDNIFLQSYEYYIQEIEKNTSFDMSFFIEYLKKSFPRESYLIARYDVAIDIHSKKLKFLEINANTPGMITDINDIAKFLRPEWYKNISSWFQKYIKTKFKKYTGKKLWILLPHAYADEDFMVCHDYSAILEPIFGKENIIIGDIYESHMLWNIFTLKWEKIDVILNFFPLEFFLTDVWFAKDFFDGIKNKYFDIYNNIESIILQDKLMFAIIWENIKKFTPEEQEVIKNHIPFTTRTFQEDENKFVAKYRWWRLSRWVYEKNFYSNIDNKEDFVFQEKIHSHLIDKKNNFLILWIYSDLKKTKAVIARKQDVFITDDDKVHVLWCYIKK